MGNQPQTGTIALVSSHLAAQSGEATRTFVGGAGELNHQVGAEGSKAPLLLGHQLQRCRQAQRCQGIEWRTRFWRNGGERHRRSSAGFLMLSRQPGVSLATPASHGWRLVSFGRDFERFCDLQRLALA
jgi:hypothetical protein